MRSFGIFVIAFLLCLIAGCSVGIRPDSGSYPNIEFSADVGYQEAYRRADAFARGCHTSTNVFMGSFSVSGNLYTDSASGVVRVNLPNAGRDLEIINIKSSTPGTSLVIITVWGVGIWDEQEMEAAKRSILSGTPSCK